MSADVEVVSEPLTYRRDLPAVSMFKDVISYQRGARGAVADRLERHEREYELEQRTHPDRTAGTGGNFAPPLWLINEFANVPQPGRVLADLIPNFVLPSGVQSINVPVLTAGMTTAIVADDATVTIGDVTDTVTTSPVVTIAGFDDVSQQLFDQSPQGAHLDQVLFKSLTESYNAQLETQLINGTGSGGQLTGLLNLSGINAITYTDASPTATEMFAAFGQAVAAIGINRKHPPETWLMNTPRQAWIASSEDSQQRPLMVASSDGPGEFQLVQYPVHLTDAIPRNLGGGTNQDVVIACRPSDMLLFESAPHLRVMADIAADTESSSAGTLSIRVELHRYVAAIVGRYPTGIAAINGTGMVTQTGF
jgi:HK97 family phage major capsid protein